MKKQKRITIATPLKRNVLIPPSREQAMFQEMFSGQTFWNLPEDNLPRMEGSLMPNRFGRVPVNEESSEDLFGFGDNRDTASLFGLR